MPTRTLPPPTRYLLAGWLLWLCLPAAVATAEPPQRSKETYVRQVVRGAAFLPWQQPAPAPEETAFRGRMEARKSELLAARGSVAHPRMRTAEDIALAKQNIEHTEWGKRWFASRRQLAEAVLAQPANYVEQMISEQSPTNTYGFTCPHCVGQRSQEGAGSSLVAWSSSDPEHIACRNCGQRYPDAAYPEEAILHCPRMGKSLTYYRNSAQRADPEDRTGKLAWKWVGRPIHVSFEGVVRQRKVDYMTRAVAALADLYLLDGDPRYAAKARDILVRLAHCYRHWLYQDYWNSVADCDPLYAVWHDSRLPLEFKRHLCEDAFAKDSLDKASMLQTYWGGGRFTASTDSITALPELCIAYDAVADAVDASGEAIWSSAERSVVERDLILEWVFGAEPYVGGAGEAQEYNNKSPRIYHAMAAVGKCLALPTFADTALRGYQAVRGHSFLPDGFSTESPSYTNMYLQQLVQIPETLVGFEWPEEFAGQSSNQFNSDPQLRMMFAALRDQLLPHGAYPPLSDSRAGALPSASILEIGLKRYPQLFSGTMPLLTRGAPPTDYAVFNLAGNVLAEDSELALPELFFPNWMNAFLRHGQGPQSTILSLSLSPDGGHRHRDNLALYYLDSGRPMLGDHGYVGDMPVNAWIKSTHSHNLVLVDDQEQLFSGTPARQPSFEWMVSSPHLSAVEGRSQAYEQCQEYRRLTVLLKGPQAQTVAVDIFRVRGGKKHAYRIFSERGASDAAGAALRTDGLQLPPEPPLPRVGNSLKREDIFGRRDIRVDPSPADQWTASWQDEQGAYRLWMTTAAQRVEAANAPGQQSLAQAGRRVRYVDTIRESNDADLKSIFVAVHEPQTDPAMPRVRSVKRLPVDQAAGENAVALEIETTWGSYLLLNEFDSEQTVADVRFAGRLGVICQAGEGRKWLLTSAASTCRQGEWGFEKAATAWQSTAQMLSSQTLQADTPCPLGMQALPDGFRNWVAVEGDFLRSGYPVARWQGQQITVERFPLPRVKRFELPAVRYAETAP